ncbi:YbjN domain-containing protein [Paenibacillus endoradicis]|uniref:YbjN domain-containing protein n=1 Tax=Paenibacillus endoradicis TaxID=2972487 RepID=UPI002158F08F|nr:YbjN domain-containing protein [Paenibacillus endoradicis]MCR8657461.1 YbjN domain-containing protein [Paenibacillus endoradicis]
MKVISSVSTSTPAIFQSWSGRSLSVLITSVVHQQQDELHYITMTTIVEPEQMATIFHDQWFHVTSHAMLNDVSFEAEDNIELKLILAPSVARQIVKQEADAEAILLSVIPDTFISRTIPELTQAELWYVVEAMQTVSLPIELAHEGQLRHGFHTIWRQELLHSPSTRNMTSQQQPSDSEIITNNDNLSNQLEQFLVNHQIKYDFHNEQLIRLKLHGKNQVSWTELIRIEDDSQLIIFYAIFPTLVDEQHREQFALQFINENYDLMNGAFEMDIADGELRFRSTLLCPTGIDEYSMMKIMNEHVLIMEQYVPALQDIT